MTTTLVTPRRLAEGRQTDDSRARLRRGCGRGGGLRGGHAVAGEVDWDGGEAFRAVNGAEAVKMSVEAFESPAVSKLAPLSK